MKIGVLALQGAFIEHEKILKKLNIDCFEIRNKEDALSEYDGLIIPGGESTVISKLLKELEMFDIIKEKIKKGMPCFGTCAGLILLSNMHLGLINVEVKRNAYGRQLGSFITKDKFNDIDIPMVFIRAPYIEKITNDVKILSVVDNNIVAARQNNILVTAYHPELTDDFTVHKYFIDIINEKR
ncbi:pyridoxal 5'-phosphate synthase glutaminase subunit PdxT [Oceanivirga salmonicida]|uniref:pyridoxal 5'-phosphate synthase glutaminase subunit PdxT n=1 Tax=Oceanivirga salmonicida TaxID=1769291 RepID=UPI00082EFA78|nr:pyridoxal 5'-phosphate synthase glutaminase subunit PdxT [Oceanivirga salmonicida]